jgi:hypothetical protein
VEHGREDRVVVLVNGLPGAGKTTLARSLACGLRVPMFSKDVIKEAHADVFGARPPGGLPQRDWNRMFGAAANQAMCALLTDSACGGRPGLHLAGQGDLGIRQSRPGIRAGRPAAAGLVRGPARARQGALGPADLDAVARWCTRPASEAWSLIPQTPPDSPVFDTVRVR